MYTSPATVGAIAAPQTGVRIEPEAGGVVVVERASADQGARPAGSEDDPRIAHLLQCGTSRFDSGNQPRRSGGVASTRVARGAAARPDRSKREEGSWRGPSRAQRSLSGRVGSHSYSRSAIAFWTEDSSMTDL